MYLCSNTFTCNCLSEYFFGVWYWGVWICDIIFASFRSRCFLKNVWNLWHGDLLMLCACALFCCLETWVCVLLRHGCVTDTFDAVEGWCLTDESHGSHWHTQTALFVLCSEIPMKAPPHPHVLSPWRSALYQNTDLACMTRSDSLIHRTTSSLGRLNVFLFKFWWRKKRKEALSMWASVYVTS